MKLYRPLLAEVGLTYPQYLVMLVLWESGDCNVSEIGSKLQLDSGTLTPLLKRLEKSRLLERTRSASDERIVIVKLTIEGKSLKEKAKSIPSRLFDRSGLSLAQAKSLKIVLDTIC